MPVWQALREELHPKGLEIVTVALDSGGIDHAGQWIVAANPTHPSLIDRAHLLTELFGIANVPSGVWIDEDGIVVRPPEPTWPGRSVFREIMAGMQVPEDADPYVVKALEVTKRIVARPERTLEAIKDWVAHGSASPFVMKPEQVVAASRPRSREHAEAAAHFELGEYLHNAGHAEDAIEHFKEAHRLYPENWTYKRQAWNLVSPVLQNAREIYGTDWASEVAASGPENYYPSL